MLAVRESRKYIIAMQFRLLDLKLRGRKETDGNEVDDYDDSGVTTKEKPFTLIFVLVTFIVYLHHYPQLRTFHPAWKPTIHASAHHQILLSIATHRTNLYIHLEIHRSGTSFEDKYHKSRWPHLHCTINQYRDA